MKKLMLFVLCLLFTQISFAQFKFGVRAGMSTTDVKPSELLIKNGNDLDELGIALEDAKYGLHFGFFAQANIGHFFIQPEVLFNSNSIDYTVRDFSVDKTATFIRNEKFQNLDIPLMIGYKLGPLRLQGGPVAHVFINSSSELFEFDEYDQNFKDLTWGYQAGVGLDIWKFVLDFKYEGNFQKFGDHLVFFGNEYEFDDSPGRMVASLGIAF